MVTAHKCGIAAQRKAGTLLHEPQQRVALAAGCELAVAQRRRAVVRQHLVAQRLQLGIVDPILIGHSDGASIALIHAGARVRPVRALVAMAPHVFVEDLSIANITRARHDYESADLRARLGRYHLDADSAFRGWNDIWLSPAFRDWNIESYLPGIDCPLLLIQGRDDEYGTLAQLDAIERQVRGRVDRVELLDCGHSPHRDQPLATLEAITGFVSTVS